MPSGKGPRRVTQLDRERTTQAKTRARAASSRATGERHKATAEQLRLQRAQENTKRTELNINDRLVQNAARNQYASARDEAREQYARNREAARILRVQNELRAKQEARASSESSRNPLGNVRLPSSSPSEVTGGTFSTPEAAHKTIVVAWIAGLSIITFQEIKASGQPPIPKYLVGWTATMGMLDLFAPLISPQVASVFAVGLTIGLGLFRNPTKHDLKTAGQTAADNTKGNGPFKSGQQTSIGGGQGSGTWTLGSDGGMYWEKFNSWTATLGANHPYPSSDPTHSLYVYNAGADQWMLKSKLTGPLYNPSVAPSSTMVLQGG